MVFQSYAIWPHMSVFENVAFPLRVAKGESYGKSDIARLVGEALETVDLGGFEKRSPTQLSGGQQQRVALARAIVRNPQLLLLDEPLSNLDAKLRDEMRTELKRLQQRIGVTTIYVTHDQAEALEMSDLIAVVNKGRLVQLDTPRNVYYEPRDVFVAGFMGATNLLSGTTESAVGSGESGIVRLGDGRRVGCRFPNAIASGQSAAVSLRPEIIKLAPAGTEAPARCSALEGTVVSSGFLGATSRYRIDAGGLMLEGSIDAAAHFEHGSRVAVYFPIDQAVGLASNPA